MLNWARLTKDLRGKMWAETANTATDHEVIIVYPGESMSSFKKFFEKEAPHARYLYTVKQPLLKIMRSLKEN